MASSGLNITVWSYADQLSISVLADERTLSDPHEATDALIRSFHDIFRGAGFGGELSQVSTALPQASVV